MTPDCTVYTVNDVCKIIYNIIILYNLCLQDLDLPSSINDYKKPTCAYVVYICIYCVYHLELHKEFQLAPKK